MPHDYQDRLDYLYSRLNYERRGMPKSGEEAPAEAGCGASCGRLGRSPCRSADHPRRGYEGERFDRGDALAAVLTASGGADGFILLATYPPLVWRSDS